MPESIGRRLASVAPRKGGTRTGRVCNPRQARSCAPPKPDALIADDPACRKQCARAQAIDFTHPSSSATLIVTRFAPSPTGLLHAGHVRAALFAERRAREAAGRFLLRIEDIDTGRCRAEFAQAILDDLAWLGIAWDGPPRVQSRHLADYAAPIDRLRALGLLYPCFCTRADIAASAGAPHTDPDGAALYPGTCRTISPGARELRLAGGEAFALRLDMARAVAACGPLTIDVEGEGTVAARPERFGDVVLARRDVRASYHLCATHDDACQGVTLVTRGEDLRPAADLHRLLQALLGWPATRYAHVPLLRDAGGRRLAKRDASLTVRALRAAGRTPAEVRAMA